MTFYRMMETKHPVGCKLQPKGGPHIDPDVEAILAAHRKAEYIDRSAAVYFIATLDFSSLGLPYEKGFIHIVEPIGDVQRRDQKWLGELQVRHEKKQTLREFYEKPLFKARRKEFERLSDAGLCENYFSGAMSRNPVIELVAVGATVTGYHSEEAVFVSPGLRDAMPKG